MLPKNWRLGVCALGLAAMAASPVLSAPGDEITGDWKLDGKDGIGHYAGTAHVEHGSSDTSYTATMSFKYDNGTEGAATFSGIRAGKYMKGQRTRTAGITGVLSNIKKKPQTEWFTLSADGLKLAGDYSNAKETLSRDAKPTNAKATLAADKQVVLVPGAPSSIAGKVHVDVKQGSVKLEVSPAGALKVDAPASIGVGSFDFAATPVSEGTVEVRLTSNGTIIDKASVSVVKEKLYLVVFGYMGPEVTYESGDMETTKSHILPKLRAAGYTVVEDGTGYSQSSIDKALNDPKSGAKKVVVDWNTTTADWNKYFDRGSIAGYAWSSHGFMEPYPGCPDAELKTFESRQWTGIEGDPSITGDKHFIREWRSKFEKNAYTMDFGLNHACCTGGIGDYASEAWEYCDSATQDRVKQVFGSLPAVSALSFTTHESLKGHFSFQQNFDGSAYFGMYDVRWSQLEASIKP